MGVFEYMVDLGTLWYSWVYWSWTPFDGNIDILKGIEAHFVEGTTTNLTLSTDDDLSKVEIYLRHCHGDLDN